MEFREPLLMRVAVALGRVVGPALRLLAHVILLPVDLLFLAFDALLVNLRKTGLFANDCRGPFGSPGSPCPPVQKYTNRFLFRFVCRDVSASPEGGPLLCGAGQSTRIHAVRGVVVLLLVGVIAAGAAWAVVTFWPSLETPTRDPASVARLVAERRQQARAALDVGNYSEALSAYRGALALQLDNKELRYEVGRCWEALEEPEAAMACFREAAEGPDAHAPAVNAMARLCYERGDVGLAGAYASRALELGADDGSIHAILADYHLWLGDRQTAALHLDAAVQRAPEHDVVRVVRARSLILEGRLDEADELLRSIGKESSVALLAEMHGLDLLWKRGRRSEAIEAMRQLAREHPRLAGPSLLLVDALFSVGRRQEALTETKGLEERFPGSPAVVFRLAGILVEHGADGRAVQVAEDCEGEPEFGRAARILVGNVYLRRGLHELAQSCARRVLAEEMDHVPALVLSGRAALARGDADEAGRRAAAGLKLEPRNASAWQLLANAQTASGDTAAALESLARACELRPEAGDLRQAYGLALVAVGRNAQAREELLKAAELLPMPYHAYTALGILAQQDGDRTQAEEYYGRALRAAPERAVVAANNLADMLLAQDRDLPLALAFAYLAHAHARGAPQEAEVADTLAHALIKTGYPVHAASAARMAARAEPDDAERQFRLGLAEAAVGNTEAAVAALARARAESPDADWAAFAAQLVEKLKKGGGQPPEAGGAGTVAE